MAQRRMPMRMRMRLRHRAIVGMLVMIVMRVAVVAVQFFVLMHVVMAFREVQP